MPYLNFPSCWRMKVSIDVRLKIKMLTTGNSPGRKSETELVAYTAHCPTVAVHQCGDGGFLRPKPCNKLSGQFRKYWINLFCLTLQQMFIHPRSLCEIDVTVTRGLPIPSPQAIETRLRRFGKSRSARCVLCSYLRWQWKVISSIACEPMMYVKTKGEI